jgi:hypothetical protein
LLLPLREYRGGYHNWRLGKNHGSRETSAGPRGAHAETWLLSEVQCRQQQTTTTTTRRFFVVAFESRRRRPAATRRFLPFGL